MILKQSKERDQNFIKHEEEEEVEFGTVSDAEALLACYSFLQRRKKMGNWTKYERRQLMKASSKPHFFWEEQDEEIEMRDDYVDIDDEEDPDALDMEDSVSLSSQDDDNNNNDDDNRSPGFGEFTTFPIGPTTARIRRSQAAKKTWQDPEFKKRWYESRWGGRNSKDNEEKILESRVRALPADFWGSPELAAMTEEEIAIAIETYAKARETRSKSRIKTLRERKPPTEINIIEEQEQKRLPRDTLFTLDQETLKEKQRQRSERAKKAYEKRLQNKQEKKLPKRTHRRAFIPTRATPQDAIFRIEDDLDRGVFPPVEDVRVIMKPGKLAKRRELLKRILLELFDLCGKCVPMDLENPEDSPKQFVTQCSIRNLGDFVIHLLEEQNAIQQENP